MIEQFKSYTITNTAPKSVLEVDIYRHPETGLYIEMQEWWRSASYIISPRHVTEVFELEHALQETDSSACFDLSSFEDVEYLGSHDGQGFTFNGTGQIDIMNAMESAEGSDNSFSYQEFLDEEGYEHVDHQVTIYGGIELA